VRWGAANIVSSNKAVELTAHDEKPEVWSPAHRAQVKALVAVKVEGT
jgi:hypothetical protein